MKDRYAVSFELICPKHEQKEPNEAKILEIGG